MLSTNSWRVTLAFDSPKRIELIDVLIQGERNVESLAREAFLPTANASQHLQILKSAGLVVARKEGLQVMYRLADPSVLEVFRTLRSLAESRIAELGRIAENFFANKDGAEPISREEHLERVRSGEALILDVRPPEEYEAGHIAGALSIPLSLLEQRLESLPMEKTIVAYCRGRYCFLSVEAIGRLRQKGFHAFRLKEGYPEWRDASLQIETVQSIIST